MAQNDEALLSAAGMNPGQLVEVLGRSRQAIAKGVKSPRRYFDESDVTKIYLAATKRDPLARPRLRHLITDSFRDFADRILATETQSSVADAIKNAQVAWVIAPGFALSYSSQQQHFDHLINLLNRDGNIAVLAFTDRHEDTLALSRHFDQSWFREHRLRVITCPLVASMPAMLITSPELRPNCFVLLADGFAPLSALEAARCVSGVGAALSGPVEEKVPPEARPPGRAFDLVTADIKTIKA